jgi:hypothetical protein
MEINKFLNLCENYIEERKAFKNEFLKSHSICKRIFKKYKNKEFEDLFKLDVQWLKKYKDNIFHQNGLKIKENSEEYMSIEELKEILFYLESHAPKLQDL